MNKYGHGRICMHTVGDTFDIVIIWYMVNDKCV
jgi:hypothetical protein